MKKYKKILILLLVVLLLIFVLTTTAYASSFNPEDYKPGPGGNNAKLKSKAQTILGVIQAVGSVVSVIALAVIGIKYMIGSVEEKAEYKKTMLPYIIGAVLVFATSNLVSILYNIGNDINNI